MNDHDRSREVRLSGEERRRLRSELDSLRERRGELVASLSGDAPAGDQADQANALERTMELERTAERLTEITGLLEHAGEAVPGEGTVAVGTAVTVRFSDGTVETLQISDLAEEDPTATITTSDSPLGEALLGRRAGDEVTYDAPDGRLTAHVLAVRSD